MDSSATRPPTTYLRSFLLLFLPDFLFYATLSILFLRFGGQHDAILGRNKLCSNPIPIRGSIGDQPRVVMHITDLHLLEDESRKVHKNLELFQKEILPDWAPLIHSVVVSGDLVHAIPPRQRFLGKHSRQSNKEWQLADDFLLTINQNIRGNVLVTHGNHDSFGGRIEQHDQVFGVSELANPSIKESRVRKHAFNDDKLVIYALDATLSRPFHRPFNFFGDGANISRELTADLDRADEEQQDVLVFSHYPTAVQKEGAKIREAAYSLTNSPRIKAYLSGHLHNIHGFSPRGLAAISKSGNGMLELETPDMSVAGAYRIVVYDSQGIVSTTVSFVEPMKSGTIRVLSPRINLELERVEAFVDGISVGTFKRTEDDNESSKCITCRHIYYVPYEAEKYNAGVHKLILSNGKNSTEGYIFSIDGAPDYQLKVIVQRITSALLAFSKFDSMVEYLCSTAFILAFVLTMSRIDGLEFR